MMAERTPRVALSVESLDKAFVPGIKVLIDVNLQVQAGEIHGLVGQNGAGKSTIVKICTGRHAPDSGRVLINGHTLTAGSPQEAYRQGIRWIHQDPTLAKGLSVEENLCMKNYSLGFGWRIRRRSRRAAVRAALDTVGLSCRPTDLVGSLSSRDQALLGVARAFFGSDEQLTALIVDEATSALGEADRQPVLDAVRRVAATGRGVLFVSHNIEEVLDVSDRVTVLRDGRVVACMDAAEATGRAVVELMLGGGMKDHAALIASSPKDVRTQGTLTERHSSPTILEARSVTGRVVRGLDLTVQNEILGVTGIAGSGYEELPYILAGDRRIPSSGKLVLGGQVFELGHVTTRTLMRNGVSFVPGDRAAEASARGLSVRENVTINQVSRLVNYGVISHKREASVVAELIAKFDIRPQNPENTFGMLSGGNQQKVIVAKWLATSPKVLILLEPTIGIDVGARRRILIALKEYRDSGGAVILATSDLEFVVEASDRIAVIVSGRVSEIVDPSRPGAREATLTASISKVADVTGS